MQPGAHCLLHKPCSRCGQTKYYLQFPTKGSRRSRNGARKNICRKCARKKAKPKLSDIEALGVKEPMHAGAAETMETPARRLAPPAPPPSSKEGAAKLLRRDRQGIIRMRGKSNNGKRWIQDIDWSLAVLLVEQRAAVVLNPYMIRRLYSNDDFRKMILQRDRYTCYYCGEIGDTIDHIVPKSKGGHTTPVNCVCSCYDCNQSKADQDADRFIGGRVSEGRRE
ncbi:HNH endonuclease [Paenibacillus naphthalenovorans]|uniref:HNH endonuclease n=1 Tax=Paenibacillus naphthalenovorans TaxID=162209 RepID=UPI003D2896F9